MKNFTLFILLAIGYCIPIHAQCNNSTTTGDFTAILDQKTSFTALPNAQYDSCYDWYINNHDTASNNQTIGTLNIIGIDMKKTVIIEPTAMGSFSIHVSYMDEKGYHTANLLENIVVVNEITNNINSITYS